MTMLLRNEIDGPYSYCAGYVIPAQSPESEKVHPLHVLKGTPTEDSVQTVLIDVAEGVPYLMGSATTNEGAYPVGVTVTMTDPNGTQVGPSQTDTRVVMCVENDPTMIQSCMIQNPMAGTWTVTVTNADTSSYVFFSTMPTEAQYTTIIDTLTPIVDPAAMEAAREGSSAGCWVCQIACWSLAVVVTMLLVFAAGMLTVASAPVTGLVALMASIGVALQAATALVVVQALLAGAGATAFVVVDNICSWLNACSTGITARIASPKAGSTVSGTTSVSASAQDAISVSFYADGNTLIGTDNTGPNWDTDWDTRKFSNGTHTVWALATGTSGANFSPQVNVTVLN
ncbi:Ig-like domain-containing protein [Streptomyces sp. NBC_01022]|uniref:Ig-like domain-containing protein n=1 Tax=Streptomyces sp. NBC_01022 TaxID=2903723 RepID=UPI002DD7B110|nr:Ig-like domain-containing protein [Streptomyces sp. NBC_01022]WRZ83998.1 Ig-like domain-containing protein [Streptomyces sp. NBC_01022]